MTDAQIVKLAEAIKPKEPARDGSNKLYLALVLSVAGGIGSLVLTVVGAIAIYFITTSLSKSDTTSLAMAGMITQIGTLQKSVAEVREELKSMNSVMNNARVDPFTGANGIALERRMKDDMEVELTKFRHEVDRKIEMILPQ